MNRQHGSSRGYSRRKVKTRSIKKRFLIVCEGKKTEPNYFRSFRVPRDVVSIEGVAKNPSKLVEEAAKLKDEGDYNQEDQVWCVFDRDSWEIQDFNNAIQSANSRGFKIAYSNEAFELWYILHFEFLNSGLPRADYSKKLHSLLGHRYRKNSETIYEEILERQETAIRNADKLLEQYGDNHIPATDNPSTTVHFLVQELNRQLV